MNRVICIFLIIAISICNREIRNFDFDRTLVCSQKKQQRCSKWDEQIQIFYQRQWFGYLCFSQETFVLAESGPISMKQIKVGTKIMSYSLSQDKPKFSQIVAWLHRNTDTYLQYQYIRTESRFVYSVSSGHNIAYQKNGTLGFKFVKDLVNGDELITIGKKQIVSDLSQSNFEKGLYSPYTLLGNFYIFPKLMNTSDWKSAPMILVHCLSQIQQPHMVTQHWFHFIIASVSQFMNLNNHENLESEAYKHPSTHLLQIFSPNSQGTKIKTKHFYTTGKNDNELQRQQSGMSICVLILQMTGITLVDI